MPPGNAQLMAGKIAGAKVKILDGVGHMFSIEDPAATAVVITGFLG